MNNKVVPVRGRGQLNKMQKAAIIYARLGFSVFPANGKVPTKDSSGYKDGTKHEPTICDMFARPKRNIAISTGSMSGITVIDIDPRHGGNGTWTDLMYMGWCTPFVHSGSDPSGYHLYYRQFGYEGKAPKQLGAGVDVLDDGKYVMAPPSIHPETGKEYRWDLQCHILHLRPQKVERDYSSYWDRKSLKLPAKPTHTEIQAAIMAMLDIVDVRGDEHRARCPVHDEENPSFSVNFGNGMYQCFGCGFSGRGLLKLKWVLEDATS